MNDDIRLLAESGWQRRTVADNVPAVDDDVWKKGCTRSANGEIDGRNAVNVMKVLREAPAWQGVLAYDEFAQRVIVRREMPQPGPVPVIF